jgi:hypothetical protein
MIEREVEERIRMHQSVIGELNRLSPEIESYNMRISQFILNHPGVIGLPYSAVEILMKEKTPAVTFKAIKIIREELQARRDPDSPGYRFKYRAITDSRVRKIILECRSGTKNNKSDSKLNQIPIELVCPHCNMLIQCTIPKRDKVVSVRGSAITDDAIDYLASGLGVSRSSLANKLLSVEHKYGYGLKK